jgi:hypothetical protein
LANQSDNRHDNREAVDPGRYPPADDGTAIVRREFSLAKALFEIAIVAIGVLLALLVDQSRQSRADRALADEARSGMRAEIEQNRIRLATKLQLLHKAFTAIDTNPAAAPILVDQAANFQITLTDAAWTMAIQTGTLRLLDQKERQALSYIYSSHDIYNRLLAEEMNRWTALAAADSEGSDLKLWKAYARRVAVGACISTIRIERFRNPRLDAEPLRSTCQRYRPSVPVETLFRDLGIPMPDTNWRPGGEFDRPLWL